MMRQLRSAIFSRNLYVCACLIAGEVIVILAYDLRTAIIEILNSYDCFTQDIILIYCLSHWNW